MVPVRGTRSTPDPKPRADLALRLIAVAATIFALPGCVRRTMTITTEPPGAMVYLNDQEVGRSAVTTDFLWYGDYDVTIRRDGYRTLHTNWVVRPPWYQLIPLDFFTEVLWPGQIHDQRSRHFVLEPASETNRDELIQRAIEAQAQTGDARG